VAPAPTFGFIAHGGMPGLAPASEISQPIVSPVRIAVVTLNCLSGHRHGEQDCLPSCYQSELTIVELH
jgi:hypothetical protein